MILDSNSDSVQSEGSITLSTASNFLGSNSSSTKIKNLKVAGGCKYMATALTSPCPNNTHNTFATSVSTTTDGIPAPTVDWDGWYNDSSPGPNANCAANSKSTASNTWPVFDNNSVRDNSVPTVQNLTPAYAYTCYTPNGTLAWDPTTNTLTINGTVFIDGSASINNGVTNVYKGYGTIYLSGTFYMGPNTKMCAWVKSGSAPYTCNSFWSLFAYFVIATNGTGPGQGGLVPAGDGTKLAGALFQGWLYSTNNVEADASTTIMGPVIGNSLILNTNVAKWTATWGGNGPSGSPGNAPQTNTPADPSNFTG
jgi:hypothetical protein